jgi:Fe-S-cluster containining protein
MIFTPLNRESILPLTCSRSGSCCHGNRVRLNPWELRLLADAKGLSVVEFQECFTTGGGIFLRFDGNTNLSGRKACNLYLDDSGCSVHPARPLACRLFPLGRVIQHGEATYMHPGADFPCLSECAEVLDLPKMSVANYLSGQETAQFEQAQDAYMEVMQNLADIALTLLLDTGLLEHDEFQVLATWKQLGNTTPELLSSKIGEACLKRLLQPNLSMDPLDPGNFIQAHNELLLQDAQILCDRLTSMEEVFDASNQMMAMALFMAHAVGADATGLSEWWVQIATENGAEH